LLYFSFCTIGFLIGKNWPQKPVSSYGLWVGLIGCGVLLYRILQRSNAKEKACNYVKNFFWKYNWVANYLNILSFSSILPYNNRKRSPEKPFSSSMILESSSWKKAGSIEG